MFVEIGMGLNPKLHLFNDVVTDLFKTFDIDNEHEYGRFLNGTTIAATEMYPKNLIHRFFKLKPTMVPKGKVLFSVEHIPLITLAGWNRIILHEIAHVLRGSMEFDEYYGVGGHDEPFIKICKDLGIPPGPLESEYYLYGGRPHV